MDEKNYTERGLELAAAYRAALNSDCVVEQFLGGMAAIDAMTEAVYSGEIPETDLGLLDDILEQWVIERERLPHE